MARGAVSSCSRVDAGQRRVTDADVDMLAARFPTAHFLALRDCSRLGYAAFDRVAAMGILGYLERVVLLKANISDGNGRALLSADLMELSVDGCCFLSPSTLSRAWDMRRLRCLQLSGCRSMKDDSLDGILAHCPSLLRLRVNGASSLSSPTLASPSLVDVSMAECTGLHRFERVDVPRLRSCDLSYCSRLEHRAAERVVRACPHLEELLLTGCVGLESLHIRSKALRRVAADLCAELKVLEVRGPRVADVDIGMSGVESLVLSAGTLETLDLSMLEHLRAVDISAPRLQRLNVCNCPVLGKRQDAGGAAAGAQDMDQDQDQAGAEAGAEAAQEDMDEDQDQAGAEAAQEDMDLARGAAVADGVRALAAPELRPVCLFRLYAVLAAPILGVEQDEVTSSSRVDAAALADACAASPYARAAVGAVAAVAGAAGASELADRLQESAFASLGAAGGQHGAQSFVAHVRRCTELCLLGPAPAFPAGSGSGRPRVVGPEEPPPLFRLECPVLRRVDMCGSSVKAQWLPDGCVAYHDGGTTSVCSRKHSLDAAAAAAAASHPPKKMKRAVRC